MFGINELKKQIRSLEYEEQHARLMIDIDIKSLERRMLRIERKMFALLDHLDLEYIEGGTIRKAKR